MTHSDNKNNTVPSPGIPTSEEVIAGRLTPPTFGDDLLALRQQGHRAVNGASAKNVYRTATSAAGQFTDAIKKAATEIAATRMRSRSAAT